MGTNDYCWWFGPTEKALHFKEYPSAQNENKTIIRDNVYSVHKRIDPSRLLNRFQIVTTSEEGDWRKIFEGVAGETIAAIWKKGPHYIVNAYSYSASKIFASHDNGATWTNTKTFDAATTYARTITFDEIDKIVYMGSSTEGTFYSEDYGDTWATLDANQEYGHYFQVTADNGTVYEVLFFDEIGASTPTGRIYRRRHGDTTWTNITPTITNVTNFYKPVVCGVIVCAEGFKGEGYPRQYYQDRGHHR